MTTTNLAEQVHEAIAAGHNDIYKIAAHLGVKHSSYDLRSALYQLANDGRVTRNTHDDTLTTN